MLSFFVSVISIQLSRDACLDLLLELVYGKMVIDGWVLPFGRSMARLDGG